MSSSQASALRTPPNYTAARTLRALEVLTFSPRTARELAFALGIHTRTARRLLHALAVEEYVERVPRGGGRPSGRWEATARLISLAAQLARRLPLVRDGEALVTELAVCGRSAWLAMPAYTDVLVLASAGEHAPQAWTLLPAVDSVAGAVLLAHRSAWRRSFGAQRSVMSEAHAERIRTAGCAIDYDAEQPIVAVPVPEFGAPVAALSLAAEPAADPIDAIRVASQLRRLAAEAIRSSGLATPTHEH